MVKRQKAEKLVRFYRCRVEVNVVRAKAEESIRLGPGKLVSAEEFQDWLSRKWIREDCFESVSESPDPSMTKSEEVKESDDGATDRP